MVLLFSLRDYHGFVAFLLEIILVLLFISERESWFCCFSLRDDHGFAVFFS